MNRRTVERQGCAGEPGGVPVKSGSRRSDRASRQILVTDETGIMCTGS